MTIKSQIHSYLYNFFYCLSLFHRETTKCIFITLTLFSYENPKFSFFYMLSSIAAALPAHGTFKCIFMTLSIASTLSDRKTFNLAQLQNFIQTTYKYDPIIYSSTFLNPALFFFLTFRHYYVPFNLSVYPSTSYKHPQKKIWKKNFKNFFKKNNKKNFLCLCLTLWLKNFFFFFIFFHIGKSEKNLSFHL